MVNLNRPRKVTFDKEHHYEFSINKFDIKETKTVSINNEDDSKNLLCDIFYFLNLFLLIFLFLFFC